MTDLKENEMKNLLLETCSKCGTNKYKEIEILNNKMLVKIQCPCEESSFERRQREKQEREGYQEPEIEDDPNDNFPF